MAYHFDYEKFLPQALYEAITEVRATRPWVVEEEAAARRRRPQLAPDGKLAILAADHPARHNSGLGSDPIRLGNRHEFLARILRMMVSPECDGLMATPDVFDELFIVSHLVRRAGGPSFLDDKVLVGCMQRGGLLNAVWEMEDRFTAYTAYELSRLRFDAGKMMIRLDFNDPGTAKTLEYCGNAINELRRANITPFLEPLPVKKVDGVYKTDTSTEGLLKFLGVAAGLGEGSARTWLKVPYVENFGLAAKATTMPMLVLGGDRGGDPYPVLREIEQAMNAAPNARGALVGRFVLYPGDEDPLAVLGVVNDIVHGRQSLEQARDNMASRRDSLMDVLANFKL